MDMKVSSAAPAQPAQDVEKAKDAKSSFADNLRQIDQGLEYAAGGLFAFGAGSAAFSFGSGAIAGGSVGLLALGLSELAEKTANHLDPKGAGKAEGWF